MRTEAKIFRALADETRLGILALLQDGELCVCEIIAALELPQSTASRHLAYLRNSGWVKGRRQGVWMYYRLNEAGATLCNELIPLLRRQFAEAPAMVGARERLRTFRAEQGNSGC